MPSPVPAQQSILRRDMVGMENSEAMKDFSAQVARSYDRSP
jgi:hypothetical protein